jgi:hypothetical protein
MRNSLRSSINGCALYRFYPCFSKWPNSPPPASHLANYVPRIYRYILVLRFSPLELNMWLRLSSVHPITVSPKTKPASKTNVKSLAIAYNRISNLPQVADLHVRYLCHLFTGLFLLKFTDPRGRIIRYTNTFRVRFEVLIAVTMKLYFLGHNAVHYDLTLWPLHDFFYCNYSIM